MSYDIPQSPAKRLRYYSNQFLGPQDFIDDQAAHLAHERAHLRALCVAGICEGLAVTFNTATTPLAIAPGVAVDKLGRLIALEAAATGPAPAGLSNAIYRLHVRYREVPTDMSTDTGGGAGATDFTRWHSEPLIAVTPSTGTLPDDAVVLGSFTVAAGAITQASVTAAGRQYSGLRLPGPNAATTATLTNRNDGSPDGVLLRGTLAIQREAANAVGPVLTLTNGAAGLNQDAGGAIDFNARDPAPSPPEARIHSRGDGVSSSHLVFSTKLPGATSNQLRERMRIWSDGLVTIEGQLSGLGPILSFVRLAAPLVDTSATHLEPTTTAGITNPHTLFTDSADNELYWRNHGGTNIKLTAGAGLNVGAIVGNYQSAGAALAFDDPNKQYTFKDGAASWARIASAQVRLFETGTSESVFVGLTCPAALSASYSCTFPTAPPGSTQLLQMDLNGTLSASNTVANAMSLSSTLSVGGVITASGGVTAAANQHVSLSGTGQLKHGDRILHIGAASFRSEASGFGVLNQAGYVTCTGTVIVYANIPLPAGKRIRTITVHYIAGGAGGSVTPKLQRMNPTTGTVTAVWSGANDNTGTTIESQSNSPEHVMLATDVYWVEAMLTNPVSRLYGVVIVFDEP